VIGFQLHTSHRSGSIIRSELPLKSARPPQAC